MKKLSTILLIVALVTIPGAIWAEKSDPKVWQERLIIPNFEIEPNRHTPIQTDGTYLPPIIKADLALTVADGPILLANTTRIAPGITLSFAPGTALYAHEFAQLIVEGTLKINGTTTRPVTLTTNETHPLNQTWNGIIIAGDGQATITHANIRHASPSVSCLPGATATLDNVRLSLGSLGLFSASDNCLLTNSLIQGVYDGILNIGTQSQSFNTIINAKHNDVRTLEMESY